MIRKPQILKEGTYNLRTLQQWKKSLHPIVIKDIFLLQSTELFEIRNPLLKSKTLSSYWEQLKKFLNERNIRNGGDWIYFPWSKILLHCLSQKEYFELRTNRNRELITVLEQKTLAEAHIGIAGLSVGSNIALGLLYQGIGAQFSLAEFDRLETANLNRIRAGIATIGEKKLDVTIQQMYEVEPHMRIHRFAKGLTQKNLKKFLGEKKKLDLIFDEIDDFEMKVRIRFAARAAGIPVLMFASVADKVIIDIERFDLEPERPIFHGLLGDLPEQLLEGKKMTDAEKHQYAVLFVGKENVSERAMQSVGAIGKTLVGRPQLNATVTVSGGIATYLSRKLLLGEKLPSGRRILSFDRFEPKA